MTLECRIPWLWPDAQMLRAELMQLADEGRDTLSVRRAFTRLLALGDEALWERKRREAAWALIERGQHLPLRRGYAYEEPNDLDAIRRLRPRGPRRFRGKLTKAQRLDHITGGWLGRCAGCLLGKPVEGVHTPELWRFLKATSQWPLRDYIRFGVRGKAAREFSCMVARKEWDAVRCMPVDDDTNYTAAAVLILEKHGSGFTAADVGQFWLDSLPLMSTCTAERAAYRNLALNIQPPQTALYRNPCREWIGAQIRADGWAYASLGDAERASEFAWRDACVSHVKNGIYGEMFVAAMIAAAPFAADLGELVRIGLSEIPRTSRLREAVVEALGWRARGVSYDDAIARVHERWDEKALHHWCHTISNAVICVIALLWGEEDFGRSISQAVQAGFDTDCNGATVGSILGVRLGVGRLPSRWTERLSDTLKTALAGYETVRISEIAWKTAAICEGLRRRA
ncbi:MAG: ADP-ribosylglycohydrolase family protein [Planctomycetota bacterium]